MPKFYMLILFTFPLSPPNTSLLKDNNFRVSEGVLQALDSVVMLSGNHFKLPFNTALVPSVVECLSDTKQPICDSAQRFLMLMQVCLIWDGFDGSPTSDASLPRQSLSSYGFSSFHFFFFFFFGCGMMGGFEWQIDGGWFRMGSGGGVL